MKTHDKRQCGRAVAVYVEDGQGRRVILARHDGLGLRDPVTLAFTKQELRRAAAVLREMADELPDEKGTGQ